MYKYRYQVQVSSIRCLRSSIKEQVYCIRNKGPSINLLKGSRPGPKTPPNVYKPARPPEYIVAKSWVPHRYPRTRSTPLPPDTFHTVNPRHAPRRHPQTRSTPLPPVTPRHVPQYTPGHVPHRYPQTRSTPLPPDTFHTVTFGPVPHRYLWDHSGPSALPFWKPISNRPGSQTQNNIIPNLRRTILGRPAYHFGSRCPLSQAPRLKTT